MARLGRGTRALYAAMVSGGLLLVAESVVTAFYADELRAWASPPPAPNDRVTVMHGSPYFLWEYPPGVHQERGVTVTINAHGLRGPSPALPKPPGQRRFLTTGDSSVFGFGVEDDEVFSTVAAAALGPRVEAINGATPGYSTLQTLNRLHLGALTLAPDLLVVCNLWSDNNFDAFVDKELLATVAAAESGPVARLRRALERSALFRLADWRLRVQPRGAAVRQVGWQRSLAPPGSIGRRRVAINDYAENLDLISAAAASVGAELLFVVLANEEDLGPAAADDRDKAWAPYRAVLRDTAARHGAPVLEVPALFRASGHPREALFLDEMHPTALGHRLIGEALAQRLAEAGWPSGGRLGTPGTGAPRPLYADPFEQAHAANPPTDAAPAPSGSTAPPPGPHLRGALRCTTCEGQGQILLEAVAAAATPGAAGPTVYAQDRLPPAGGPFLLAPLGAGPARLRATIDPAGDGPSPADPTVDLGPIDIPTAGAALTIDLDAKSVRPSG